MCNQYYMYTQAYSMLGDHVIISDNHVIDHMLWRHVPRENDQMIGAQLSFNARFKTRPQSSALNKMTFTILMFDTWTALFCI